MAKRLNSFLYTHGKFGKGYREKEDQGCEYLYSKGKYKTKIKKEDLTEDYLEIRGRTLWYMTGYLKMSGIQDMRYQLMKNNHLFKDDYIYISYDRMIESEVSQYGFEDFKNFDACICGNDIIPVVLAAEMHSNFDTALIRKQIGEKLSWYRENCREDYIRQFGDKEIDLFEWYK